MADIKQFIPKNAAQNPDYVLKSAIGEMDAVLLVGWDKDGALDVRASENIDHREINWLLSLVQHKLLAGDFAPEVE